MYTSGGGLRARGSGARQLGVDGRSGEWRERLAAAARAARQAEKDDNEAEAPGGRGGGAAGESRGARRGKARGLAQQRCWSSIAASLEVTSPLLPQCGGLYDLLVVGEDMMTVRGMPLWKHRKRDFWLFPGPSGQWHIGDEQEAEQAFDCDTGLLVTLNEHEGRTPDDLPSLIWLRYDVNQGRYLEDALVKVTRPAKAGLPPPEQQVEQRVGRAPDLFEVSLPGRSDLEGEYRRVPEEDWNGAPVWRQERGQHWLIAHHSCYWQIADNSAFDGEPSIVANFEHHRGRSPERMAMSGWQILRDRTYEQLGDFILRVSTDEDERLPSAPGQELSLMVLTSLSDWSGVYKLIPEEFVNACPIWQLVDAKHTRYIFSGPSGKWFLGGERERKLHFKVGVAAVMTRWKHRSQLPHQVLADDWLVLQEGDGGGGGGGGEKTKALWKTSNDFAVTILPPQHDDKWRLRAVAAALNELDFDPSAGLRQPSVLEALRCLKHPVCGLDLLDAFQQKMRSDSVVSPRLQNLRNFMAEALPQVSQAFDAAVGALRSAVETSQREAAWLKKRRAEIGKLFDLYDATVDGRVKYAELELYRPHPHATLPEQVQRLVFEIERLQGFYELGVTRAQFIDCLLGTLSDDPADFSEGLDKLSPPRSSEQLRRSRRAGRRKRTLVAAFDQVAEALDMEGGGGLDSGGLRTLARHWRRLPGQPTGYDADTQSARDVLRELDVGGDGRVDRYEFARCCAPKFPPEQSPAFDAAVWWLLEAASTIQRLATNQRTRRRNLAELFDTLDADASGGLSKDELCAMAHVQTSWLPREQLTLHLRQATASEEDGGLVCKESFVEYFESELPRDMDVFLEILRKFHESTQVEASYRQVQGRARDLVAVFDQMDIHCRGSVSVGDVLALQLRGDVKTALRAYRGLSPTLSLTRTEFVSFFTVSLPEEPEAFGRALLKMRYKAQFVQDRLSGDVASELGPAALDALARKRLRQQQLLHVFDRLDHLSKGRLTAYESLLLVLSMLRGPIEVSIIQGVVLENKALSEAQRKIIALLMRIVPTDDEGLTREDFALRLERELAQDPQHFRGAVATWSKEASAHCERLRRSGLAGDVPWTIVIVCGDTSLDGFYERVLDLSPNDLPCWRRADGKHWLFTSVFGRWIVADGQGLLRAEFSEQRSNLQSRSPHGGRLPHQLQPGDWELLTGVVPRAEGIAVESWTAPVPWALHLNAAGTWVGRYVLEVEVWHNGYPVWKHAERDLYVSSADTGRWVVSSSIEEPFDAPEGCLCTSQVHGQQMPSEFMDSDWYSLDESGNWVGVDSLELVAQSLFVPERLFLCCSDLPEVAGGYLRSRQQGRHLVHEQPCWRHQERGHWLFSSTLGYWLVCESEETGENADNSAFSAEEGLLRSLRPHGGLWPNVLDLWLVGGLTDAQLGDARFVVQPEEPPSSLLIRAPYGYGGVHDLLRTTQVFGSPCWVRRDQAQWLYSSSEGIWMVAREDPRKAAATAPAIIAGDAAHEGRQPQTMQRWLVRRGRGYKLVADDTVEVSLQCDSEPAAFEVRGLGGGIDSGCFLNMPNRILHGAALWKHEDAKCWLHADDTGRWVVVRELLATESDARGNVQRVLRVLLRSEYAHNGCAPHLVLPGEWQRYGENGWQVTAVTIEKVPGGRQAPLLMGSHLQATGDLEKLRTSERRVDVDHVVTEQAEEEEDDEEELLQLGLEIAAAASVAEEPEAVEEKSAEAEAERRAAIGALFDAVDFRKQGLVTVEEVVEASRTTTVCQQLLQSWVDERGGLEDPDLAELPLAKVDFVDIILGGLSEDPKTCKRQVKTLVAETGVLSVPPDSAAELGDAAEEERERRELLLLLFDTLDTDGSGHLEEEEIAEWSETLQSAGTGIDGMDWRSLTTSRSSSVSRHEFVEYLVPRLPTTMDFSVDGFFSRFAKLMKVAQRVTARKTRGKKEEKAHSHHPTPRRPQEQLDAEMRAGALRGAEFEDGLEEEDEEEADEKAIEELAGVMPKLPPRAPLIKLRDLTEKQKLTLKLLCNKLPFEGEDKQALWLQMRRMLGQTLPDCCGA
eukprot:TRINITY_DN18235_c0_g2_i3.p1 TRINITY_DN18235_c0_g2~~TRINITY_DN18235_c0_g2_i3.p1  ORF type:complete len:2059 (+),score=493.11 TRINITY_DN18235_c0_g2_i3:110-6286(+)